MLRYVKVNGEWIDSLSELKHNHLTYIVIDGKVHCIYDDNGESVIGLLEDESDDRPNEENM